MRVSHNGSRWSALNKPNQSIADRAWASGQFFLALEKKLSRNRIPATSQHFVRQEIRLEHRKHVSIYMLEAVKAR